MTRERIGQVVFLGAAAAAAALYALTVPQGLPWNESTHWAVGYLGGGAAGVRALPNGVTIHEVHEKRARINRIAGWVAMGAAEIFAVVSMSFHDYRLGEAASVFARGVVEEAGEGEGERCD